MRTPKVGALVNATYRSPRTGMQHTVTGTVIAGRYPHMYLHLDTEAGLVDLPLDRIEGIAVAYPRIEATS